MTEVQVTKLCSHLSFLGCQLQVRSSTYTSMCRNISERSSEVIWVTLDITFGDVPEVTFISERDSPSSIQSPANPQHAAILMVYVLLYSYGAMFYAFYGVCVCVRGVCVWPDNLGEVSKNRFYVALQRSPGCQWISLDSHQLFNWHISESEKWDRIWCILGKGNIDHCQRILPKILL